MNPTFIIAGVLCSVLLVSNTPSLTTRIGSLFAKTPARPDQPCVSMQLPLNFTDVEGRSNSPVVCPETARDIRDGINLYLDEPVSPAQFIKANQVTQ